MQSEVGNGEEENDVAISGKQRDAFDLSIRGAVRSKNGGRRGRFWSGGDKSKPGVVAGGWAERRCTGIVVVGLVGFGRFGRWRGTAPVGRTMEMGRGRFNPNEFPIIQMIQICKI
jgi:hypothetical protein